MLDPQGRPLGQAGLGNRKDIRNAVEAAAKAGGWGAATAHNRAQVLYYLAENLDARARRSSPSGCRAMTGAPRARRARKSRPPIRRLFFYAGFADKYDGARACDEDALRDAGDERAVGRDGHRLPRRGAAARACLAGRAGDRDGQFAWSSSPRPRIRSAPTDLYSVLDTSDVPAGVVNIVTGEADALAKTLAEHDGVDALWYVGPARARQDGREPPRPAISRRPGRAGRRATGPTSRAGIPAPRDAGEEHLDALRGVRPPPLRRHFQEPKSAEARPLV